MKLLTLNFLTCAIKTCKTQSTSFPLHPRDAELEIQESDINLPFLKNILPRLMWDDLRTISKEVRFHRTLHCSKKKKSIASIQLNRLLTIQRSSAFQTYLLRRQRRAILYREEEKTQQKEHKERRTSRCRVRRRWICIVCCWRRVYRRASLCAGAAGMSMRSKRGLRISCCRGIWYECGEVTRGWMGCVSI